MSATLAALSTILIATSPAQVAGCQLMGTVEARAPFLLPGSDIRQLQKRASEIVSVNTIYVTARGIGVSHADIYHCEVPSK
jgi:hypothetical protein